MVTYETIYLLVKILQKLEKKLLLAIYRKNGEVWGLKRRFSLKLA